uniref:C-type lectin domain-containing protein n=1 Tax=Dicentrarchus labrax TaxID=13489 RepID=A0A8C4EQW8_DICLA
ERDLLNARITEMTEELERLQSLSKQGESLHESCGSVMCLYVYLTVKTCPEGWKMFNYICYLLSTESGTWDKAREDCRNRGADLVVIDSEEEEMFLFGLAKKQTWIGLTDREEEGTWKWIDGTPLTLKYWAPNQPDNGGGDSKWGEEDCAQIRDDDNTHWNDLSCEAPLQWFCEK